MFLCLFSGSRGDIDTCVMYCVDLVQIGSRQYIVFPGRWIYTQRLKGANVNDKVRKFLIFFFFGVV